MDPPTAQNTINSFETFDAHEDILVVIAHGPAAMDNFTFLPQGTMNDWQSKNGNCLVSGAWWTSCHMMEAVLSGWIIQ